MPMVQIFAHRGASWVAPENTFAAFESAHRSGAHGIELDIQLTADGFAAVIHDSDIDRTTDGKGKVSSFNAVELATFDAGTVFSPAYAGQRVPLLGRTLDFLSTRTSMDILLEFKGKWQADQVAPVLEAITNTDLTDRIVLQSFDTSTLKVLQTEAPDIQRDLLITSFSRNVLQTCEDLQVRGCNPSGVGVRARPGLVKELRDAGYEMSVWTLNEPGQLAQALDLGVDRIITDRPEFAMGFLAGREAG